MLLDLPILSLALCALAAFIAAFVRGLAGFGMAILLVPLIARTPWRKSASPTDLP